YPTLSDTGSFRLYTHGDVYVGSASRRTLWLLFGASALVLLIACANTATLLLVRASTRQREIAVRASIGAGPRRILQQLLIEGVVLSSIASLLGVVVSVVALRGFLSVAPSAVPGGADPSIDARVLAFVVAVAVGTGMVFGLAAAIPAYRARLHAHLPRGAQGGSRLRETLLLLQTAVTVVLLAGASLLATSFARLLGVDPGFDADRVVAVRLGRLPPGYDAARREQLVTRLLDRFRALPGVEQAAAAPNLPLERGLNFPIDVPERPDLAMGAVELRYVSPGYLATLGIPLRGGRPFGDGDVAGSEPVAIVNEAFARHFWQDAPPVGRTIRIGHFKDRWFMSEEARHETRVVGVAADIKEMRLDRPAKPTVLVPRTQNASGTPVLLVRGAPSALISRLREGVLAEEPRLAPVVERLSSVVSRSIAEPRFRTLLVGSFAGFALLLAGIGIYGVIASGVQHRRREIAVRLALGASRGAVAAAVSRRCLANVAAGTIVGLMGYWAARRLITAWLFELSPGDPRVLTGAVMVLALVAALASWLPARRATRVDPAAALRLD
ncbi:MAG TPA: FtsX-like permease family protein, partial [Gemmatimonadaceae bacterium]